MRDVLIVGEDYGHSDERYHRDLYALTGASGRRLAGLCGYEGEGTLPVLQFCQDFRRTNVVVRPEQWRDPFAVRAGVARVVARLSEGDRVVLLGGRVAAAFHVGSPLFEWGLAVEVDAGVGWTYARSPHPSGRSHWWNDPANVAVAREFWTRLRAQASGAAILEAVE